MFLYRRGIHRRATKKKVHNNDHRLSNEKKKLEDLEMFPCWPRKKTNKIKRGKNEDEE